jgi:hypothetical protein
MRRWESWRAAVPELIGYDHTYLNPHPRQGAVTAANLSETVYRALVAALS